MKNRVCERSNGRIVSLPYRHGSLVLAISWVALVLATGLPCAARAGEGVVEINQAVVDASGGFPYTISSPGSYRLTGNLTVPDADTTAISITTDDVTIDLGGFAIQGVTTCTSPPGPATCSNTGTGQGINSTGKGTTIRNGHIRGMGDDGVRVENPALIVGVKAIGNGGDGIWVFAQAVIKDCAASSNGGVGIFGSQYSVVKDSTAVANGSHGIRVTTANVVEGNVARGNGEHGFDTQIHSVVRSNASTANVGDGFHVGPRSTVIGNTASGNSDVGITLSFHSTAIGNAVSTNTGFGMDLGAGTGYSQNSVNDNTGGTVTGGVDAGSNICDGTLGCP